MSGTTISTTVELFGRSVAFVRYHEMWQEDASRLYPDTRYMEMVRDLVEVFSESAIPKSCRKLQAAVELLGREYVRHEAKNVAQTDANFGAAVQGVERAVKPPGAYIPKIIEPMSELMSLPGMVASQVAKMYGLIDPVSGDPRSDLVAEELRKPGSVIGEDWEHSDEKARREAHAEIVATFDDLGRYLDQLESPKASTPCPESPRDLYNLGVTVSQASIMLCQSEQEVRQVYDEMAAEDAAPGESADVESFAGEDEPIDINPDELNSMTHRELSAYAKAIGIGVVSDKAGMLSRLKAHLEQEHASS
jgi:hypothetical protein